MSLNPIAVIASLLVAAVAPSGGPPSPIGTAVRQSDGSIVTQLRDAASGAKTRIVFAPGDPDYGQVSRQVGPAPGGKEVLLRAFETSEPTPVAIVVPSSAPLDDCATVGTPALTRRPDFLSLRDGPGTRWQETRRLRRGYLVLVCGRRARSGENVRATGTSQAPAGRDHRG